LYCIELRVSGRSCKARHAGSLNGLVERGLRRCFLCLFYVLVSVHQYICTQGNPPLAQRTTTGITLQENALARNSGDHHWSKHRPLHGTLHCDFTHLLPQERDPVGAFAMRYNRHLWTPDFRQSITLV